MGFRPALRMAGFPLLLPGQRVANVWRRQKHCCAQRSWIASCLVSNQRGTDVARAAASIVLLNDDFASLVNTVSTGRRIYDNLAHAMSFIVAVHVPIAGMGLLPVAVLAS